MLTRNNYHAGWYWLTDLAIAADFFVPVGNDLSAFQPADNASLGCMPIADTPFFSIDVFTDDAVTIEIQVGHTTTSLATMATLTCPVGAAHSTVYDLPAPHNKDGFLVLTGVYCRLRVLNSTGNVVSPFQLVAKVWR